MPFSTVTMRNFAFAALIFVAGCASMSAGQAPDATPDATAAPVPPQIASAKTVFISNAGADRYAMQFFPADAAYNRVYSDMKGWNKYRVVSAPSDADLVIEVRLSAPFGIEYHTGLGTNEPDSLPQVQLTILDARTHFILWTITGPVENAYRRSTFRKNLDQAMVRLFGSLKDTVALAVSAAAR